MCIAAHRGSAAGPWCTRRALRALCQPHVRVHRSNARASGGELRRGRGRGAIRRRGAREEASGSRDEGCGSATAAGAGLGNAAAGGRAAAAAVPCAPCNCTDWHMSTFRV